MNLIRFEGPTLRNGRVTSMKATINGKVYANDRVISEEDEPYRAAIEQTMFLHMMRHLYDNELKDV